MKYLFINPPFFSINVSPIIGVPELVGLLKTNGIDAEFTDLNISYYNQIFNKRNFFKFIQFFNYVFNEEIYNNLPVYLQKLLYEDKTNHKKNINNMLYLLSRVDFSIYVLKHKYFFYKQTLCEYAYNNISSLEKYISLIYSKVVYSFIKEDYPFDIEIENILDFFDSNANQLKEYYDAEIKKIINKKPNSIGISVNFPTQLISGLYLSYRLKKELSDIHINIGGSFFTYSYHNIKNLDKLFNTFCDSISINHNTVTILQLVKYLNNEIDIDEIVNLIYLKEKKLIINKYNKKENKSNFEHLPVQSFSGLNFNEYPCPELILPVRASISCYWKKCIFCYCSGENEFHIKPVNKVIDEIEYLSKKYNTKYFYFWDNVLHPKYIEKIADELIKRNLGIKYTIFARFEKEFTYDLLKKIRKSGCLRIHWGLDAVSDNICNYINKGINLNTVEEILKVSHKADISNFIYLLIGQPTETYKDIEEGLEFIKSNKKNINILIVYTKVLYMRDSVMWQNMEDYKKLIYLTEEETIKYKEKFLSIFKFNAEKSAIYNVAQYSILYLDKFGIKKSYLSSLFYFFIKQHPTLFNIYLKFYLFIYKLINISNKRKYK